MAEGHYFNAEILLKESVELARESQQLRLRMTVELLASTFVLVYAYASVRMMMWRGIGMFPLVLNATAWTYWAVLPYVRLLRPFRREIDLTSDTSDEYSRLIFQFESRTHRVRRERSLAQLVDLIIAAQFVALAALIAIPNL